MNSTPEQNGWTEWSKYVLKNLESVTVDITAIKSDISDIKADLKLLNFKASIWGAVGGSIPILVLLVWRAVGTP